MIGLGGGIIVTPLLVLGFGIDIRYAMGAALCSVIATSSGAAAAYLRDGISNMEIGIFLSLATTSGAICGAFATSFLNTSLLAIIFGIVLLITVLLSLHQQPESIIPPSHSDPLASRLLLPNEFPSPTGPIAYGVLHVIPGFLLMGVAGVLSGLLGIGSGAFKVLAMDKVMKLPFKVTTATSNFMIGVTAAASVGIYLKKGYIDPALVAPVILGVLGGAFLGAKLLVLVPVKFLRWVFLAAVFIVSLQMIMQGIHTKESEKKKFTGMEAMEGMTEKHTDY